MNSPHIPLKQNVINNNNKVEIQFLPVSAI